MSARAKTTGWRLTIVATCTVMTAAAGVAMTVVAGVAMAADTGLTPADRDFVSKAAQGGMMEVAAGKLAAERGLDPAVKSFGQKMVSDHSAANEQLKSLAAAKNLPLPDSLATQDQTALGKLEGLNGTEFDKTYAQMMVQDHVTDIGDFQKEVKTAQDADVKTFAAQTLPTLQHHLMLANRLSAAEKKSP